MNKYANLVGTNKIKDEYTKINTGFDGVETDINKLKTDVTAVNTRVDTIITTPISGQAATQEIVDARVSAVKAKTFASLDARFEETEQDLASHKADNAAHNGFVGKYKGLPNFTDFNELTTPGLYHGVISGEKLNEAVTATTARRLALQVTVNTTPTTNVYQELYYQDGASTIMHRRFYRQRKNPTDWLPWFEIKTSRDVVRGQGSPEGVISATVGTLYQRTDGGAGTTLYVKESGTGNTGWVAK